ncbi:hypothetical protein [Methylocystis sp. S23]
MREEFEWSTGFCLNYPAEASKEIARLRAENERLVKECDDANDALTIAYMQGAESVRERMEAAEARAQSAEAKLAEMREAARGFITAYDGQGDASEVALLIDALRALVEKGEK